MSNNLAGGLSSTVDLEANGKQHGFFQLPCSTERSANGSVSIPVCVIRRGDGPTVSILGGVHGDEYEGPISVLRLAREIQLGDVQGCIILLPSLHPPAIHQGSRLSPIDQKDLNRVFPGRTDGSLSEQIANRVTLNVLGRSDVVLDLQSGGRSLQFAPLAAVNFLQDRDQQLRAEACMIAFGAPNSARILADQSGTLAAVVEKTGNVHVTAILGGGGSADVDALRTAHIGCKNLLIHTGVLAAELTLRSTRMLEVQHAECIVHAPSEGLLELLVPIGGNVYQGNAIAHILDYSRTGAKPTVVNAPRNGVLMARHHAGWIHPGDCLAIIADEVQG